MKILCITHSTRPFTDVRAGLNFLEKRFPHDRLNVLPPLETIPDIRSAVPYYGSLTLWKLDNDSLRPNFLWHYEPDYKVQFATFHNDKLLIYGHDRLEILNMNFDVVDRITDPWLVGGHTVHVDEKGDAWVTCAPANAILRIDMDQNTVVERISMPEMYGKGFPLNAETSMHDHYIPTDLQPTHVNSAVPLGDSLLVTAWIPGAVGLFDEERNYRELISGFRGCHGAREDNVTGEIYFADSPAGILWFFDKSTSKITRRMKFDTPWLHDAVQVEGNVFAAGLSDINKFRLVDKMTSEVLHEQNCEAFGQSVMFLNCCQVSRAWEVILDSRKREEKPNEIETTLSENIVPQLSSYQFWLRPETEIMGENGCFELIDEIEIYRIIVDQPVKYEYLIQSTIFTLEPGIYRFESKTACLQGGLSVGLLKKSCDGDSWVAQLTFDSATEEQHHDIEIGNGEYCLVIAAHNTGNPSPVSAMIELIHLMRLDGDASVLPGMSAPKEELVKSIARAEQTICTLNQKLDNKEAQVNNLLEALNYYQDKKIHPLLIKAISLEETIKKMIDTK